MSNLLNVHQKKNTLGGEDELQASKKRRLSKLEAGNEQHPKTEVETQVHDELYNNTPRGGIVEQTDGVHAPCSQVYIVLKNASIHEPTEDNNWL